MHQELERLVTMYDGGQLDRRQLLVGLLGLDPDGVRVQLADVKYKR